MDPRVQTPGHRPLGRDPRAGTHRCGPLSADPWAWPPRCGPPGAHPGTETLGVDPGADPRKRTPGQGSQRSPSQRGPLAGTSRRGPLVANLRALTPGKSISYWLYKGFKSLDKYRGADLHARTPGRGHPGSYPWAWTSGCETLGSKLRALTPGKSISYWLFQSLYK